MKRRQDFGKVPMALGTLHPTFESNLTVREDIKAFLACSILHGTLWEAKVVRYCVQLGIRGGQILRAFGKGVSVARRGFCRTCATFAERVRRLRTLCKTCRACARHVRNSWALCKTCATFVGLVLISRPV